MPTTQHERPHSSTSYRPPHPPRGVRWCRQEDRDTARLVTASDLDPLQRAIVVACLGRDPGFAVAGLLTAEAARPLLLRCCREAKRARLRALGCRMTPCGTWADWSPPPVRAEVEGLEHLADLAELALKGDGLREHLDRAEAAGFGRVDRGLADWSREQLAEVGALVARVHYELDAGHGAVWAVAS